VACHALAAHISPHISCGAIPARCAYGEWFTSQKHFGHLSHARDKVQIAMQTPQADCTK
jgi:hypothetical protein